MNKISILVLAVFAVPSMAYQLKCAGAPTGSETNRVALTIGNNGYGEAEISEQSDSGAVRHHETNLIRHLKCEVIGDRRVSCTGPVSNFEVSEQEVVAAIGSESPTMTQIVVSTSLNDKTFYFSPTAGCAITK